MSFTLENVILISISRGSKSWIIAVENYSINENSVITIHDSNRYPTIAFCKSLDFPSKTAFDYDYNDCVGMSICYLFVESNLSTTASPKILELDISGEGIFLSCRSDILYWKMLKIHKDIIEVECTFVIANCTVVWQAPDELPVNKRR
jgi:hypothetical protein